MKSIKKLYEVQIKLKLAGQEAHVLFYRKLSTRCVGELENYLNTGILCVSLWASGSNTPL
jgi:hypothetical protein